MAAILVLFTCKLALVASFLNWKFKRIYSFKRGNLYEVISQTNDNEINLLIKHSKSLNYSYSLNDRNLYSIFGREYFYNWH